MYIFVICTFLSYVHFCHMYGLISQSPTSNDLTVRASTTYLFHPGLTPRFTAGMLVLVELGLREETWVHVAGGGGWGFYRTHVVQVRH